MPATFPLNLSSVTGVAAGQQATIEVPTGKHEYEAFGLELGGTFAKDQAKNIRVEVAGKPIVEFKNGAQLDTINAYYGRNIAPKELLMHFFRPEFLEPQMARIFNLGMADVPVCQIRVDIDGAAVNPSMKAYCRKTQAPGKSVQELLQNNALGAFTKVRRFVKNPTGAGRFEVDDLPREGFLQAIHIIGTGENINAVEVKADSQTIWEADKTRMENVVETFGRVRQANCYHIDFMLQNEVGGQLPLVSLSDFRLILDMAGADTLDIYVEYLSGYAGI